MWETFQSTPLGSLSMRKYLRFATAFLAACFLYIFITAPIAHAATDATWQGDSIVYENNDYNKSSVSKGTESHKIPKGSQMYIYAKANDIASNVKIKAYVIYFAPGNDPGTAKSATYQSFDLKGDDQFTNPSAKKTISIDPTGAGVATPGTTSCAVEGIGWIVCPITKFLAKGMDFVYSLVDGFLEVKPLQTTQNQAMYRAWSFMRNFANIAFVIAFLVAIYSQMTILNAKSNYTVKKLLPRIVIAAILVNTSYWICAVAIDVFNILGYSVQDIFISIRNSLVGSEGNSWDVVSWESMSSLVLSGGSLAGGVGIAAFLGISTSALVIAGPGVVAGLVFLLLPLLLSTLFVILMTFLILAARQAIITILVVLAPLAFVAYLLPNTEKWFEKWRSALFTLLLLFPAFSVVFGGSQLAAAAIMQNANSLNIILLAMAVQVAPLAITPLLLKLGGGVLNRFAGIVNNPAKGIFDRGKNWAKERTDQNKAAGMARMSQDRKRARELGLTGLVGENGRHRSGRMHPYNMAYRREQNRRTREETKTGNEALSAGLFTQTTAGQRLYGLNQDADLQKHLGEGRNYEAYKTAMATGGDAANIRRRTDHHEAHLSKGRGEVYENSLTQHAERDLQTQITDPSGPLRQVKIAADVNAAHAEFQKSHVAGESKFIFQREMMGSQALKTMNKEKVIFEKQAGSMETILQKEAEANWDSVSRRNSGLQKLRLREVEVTDQAKKAEETWNTLVANIRAEGSSAPDLATPNVRLADSIKGLTRDLEIEAHAQNSAKVVQQSNLAAAFKDDESLRARAGGVGGDAAATRIYAKAKKEVIGGYMEAIDDSRSLISEYTPKQLVKLHREGIDKNGKNVGGNEALVFAAMQELLLNKGNNWALQKLRDDTATKFGMIFDEDTGIYYDTVKDVSGDVVYDNSGRALQGVQLTDNEVESRRDAQQLFADAAKKSPLKISNLSQTDLSDFESGTSVTNGEQAIVRDIIAGKFDPQKMVGLDVDELQRMVMVLRDEPTRERIRKTNPEALTKLLANIDSAQEDSMLRGSIKDRERGVMFALASYIDPAEKTRNDADREQHYYWEKLDNGAIVRRHPNEPGANKSQASVIPSHKYLRDQFLNSKERGPDGSL